VNGLKRSITKFYGSLDEKVADSAWSGIELIAYWKALNAEFISALSSAMQVSIALLFLLTHI
jgi:hypothetical protein